MIFKKIKTKEDFKEFVLENIKDDLPCIFCEILTKGRGLIIDNGLNAIYPLCSCCQKKCLESEAFSMLISDKVRKSLYKENN